MVTKLAIERIARGAFADVLDMCDGSVVKAYRRQRHTDRAVQDWRDQDALTQGFFEAEVAIYERLSHHPDLAVFAPRFLGRVDPCGLSALADPPEEGYIRNCGLRLEKILGKDIKVSQLQEPIRGEVEKVLERLREEVGAGHVWDASCFVPGSQAKFTLIDFATWDGWTSFQSLLEECGRLTDEQRAQLQLMCRLQ